MKLVSYKRKDNPNVAFRIGCVVDGKVIDLQESYRLLLTSEQEEGAESSIETMLPADPMAFFSLGNSVIKRAEEAISNIMSQPDKNKFIFNQDEVSLGTPIPSPSKIICVGRNYADHAAEMKGDIPEYPVLFSKFSNALIGPEDAIEKSPYTDKLDYEVELTVVIGKEASHISREQAHEYIAGYTIGNDITARDLQKRTLQWLQGKTLDRSSPIGPWVVTADEVGDPASLAIRSFVNGEKRQESNTSKLIFDIPFLIEFISNLITLNPGDMIMTGTPDGVGVAMEPPTFLQTGDVVRLEIDKIGQLENRVVEKRLPK